MCLDQVRLTDTFGDNISNCFLNQREIHVNETVLLTTFFKCKICRLQYRSWAKCLGGGGGGATWPSETKH